MSKFIETIPLSRIGRIAILPGNGRSLASVKGDADFILNGGFYRFSDGKPTGHLKAEDRVFAEEPWNCWGFRWNTGPDIRMDVVPDSGGRNYISGVELLTRDLTIGSTLRYGAEIGGKRGRTALATDGTNLILYCSGDGSSDAATPEGVRDELAALGATRALLLDGGGSSQCDFHGKSITSSRRVHNYITLWLTKESPLPGTYQVHASGGLRIRKGPGTGYTRVGSYPDGTQLTLFELYHNWGRTDKGWVCLDYLIHCPPSDAAGSDDALQALFPGCSPDDPLTCSQVVSAFRVLGLI